MNLERLITSIKNHEGYRARSYKDTEGYDTIGYGFAVKDLVLQQDISHHILERKVSELIVDCFNSFPWLAKSPAKAQEVIIEMCYQMGVAGVSKFVKAIAHLKRGNWEEAAEEMLDSRWAKQTPNRANELSGIIKGIKT